MKKIFFKLVVIMKENRLYFSLILFLFFSCSSLSQGKKFHKYTVLKGETVTQIALKYKVTPYDIYKLNPDSQKGIKENDVLIVPLTSQSSEKVVVETVKSKNTSRAATQHVVQPKETFYSIARVYNIDVKDLINSNETIYKEGLQIGITLVIPGQNQSTSVKSESVAEKAKQKSSSSDKTIYHVVAPQETKYGISKQYGISVATLEQKNPEIVNGLPIGYKLIISGNNSNKDITTTATEKPNPTGQELTFQKYGGQDSIKTIKTNGYNNYEVRPGETIFSLSQTLNISQSELIALNPSLTDGLKVGMILKIPENAPSVAVRNENRNFSNLSQSVSTKKRKKLVLLIPFNTAKTQVDLKKDAFLNMTLDYYSGVLMAVDSAKTLGLNIDVKIFDSQENKNASDVVNVIKNNNLQNADAVIGPFYQQYVEQVAEILSAKGVPVISPLSKETGKTFDNLYQTIPPGQVSKEAIFNYMIAKNGNIIAVISPKKVADRAFIKSKYPGVKIVALNESGDLNQENLKALFVKDRINYVVVHTEKTALILSTTALMINELPNYQLQMVIIEGNDTLDFEEIALKKLATLKMLYPSISVENNSPEAMLFKNAYKNKNKVFPSQYAVRGFDITFDTMLRLSQEGSFEETAFNSKTQQIESQFDYVKDADSEFVNKGVYILEYQEDYSVKQVK